MKATFYLLTIIFFSICFVACEKDNLDIAPNATFGGEIRDMETGELVEQEIIRGSQIYFIELDGTILLFRQWLLKMTEHSKIISCLRAITK